MLLDGTYPEVLNNLIHPGVTLRAAGTAAIIQPTAEQNADFIFYTTTPDITLDGIILDAVNVNNYCCQYMGVATNCRLLNCEIKNAPGQGILNGGNANGLYIANCSIHDNGTSAQLDHGIYSGQTEVTIRNCNIYNNASRGIHMYGGPDYATYLIEDNYVHDNGAQGIGCYYGQATIKNNVVRRNPYNIVLMYDPVYALVANNTCTEATNRDINVEGFNAMVTDITIVDNVCLSDGTYGIAIAPAALATGTIAVSNNLSDNHATADYYNPNVDGAIVPTLSANLWNTAYTPATDDTAEEIIPGVGNPAIGAGVAIAGITTDYGGNVRSNPPTIGAWE